MKADIFDVRNKLEELHGAGYGWALACCSYDQDQAAEILQTVYVKILEGSARFDGKAQFKTWLFSVIRNTAADIRRKNLLRTFGLARYVRASWSHNYEERNPGEKAGQAERRAMMQKQLAKLPRRQRETLHLVFYQELTLSAAAKIMGISVGSARTHYERGKKNMKQMLEEKRIRQ